jgi:hypothetical protein
VPVLTRRKFAVVSSLTLLPVTLACGSSDDDTLEGCDGAGAVSTVDDGHSHTVCIPASDMARMPTVPLLYTTSTADGHTHQLTLSPEQIATLAGSGTVEVTTTVDAGHQHGVTLVG